MTMGEMKESLKKAEKLMNQEDQIKLISGYDLEDLIYLFTQGYLMCYPATRRVKREQLNIKDFRAEAAEGV